MIGSHSVHSRADAEMAWRVVHQAEQAEEDSRAVQAAWAEAQELKGQAQVQLAECAREQGRRAEWQDTLAGRQSQLERWQQAADEREQALAKAEALVAVKDKALAQREGAVGAQADMQVRLQASKDGVEALARQLEQAQLRMQERQTAGESCDRTRYIYLGGGGGTQLITPTD